MKDLALDIRICFRNLLRRPLFATVAVLTLGLGIGATTAMIGVVRTVLLPDLQYEEPERLVTLWQEWPGYRGLGNYINLTDDQYRLWRDETTVFEEVAMFNASEWGFGTLTDRGRPSRIGIGSATASLAGVLGVHPHLGRWFLPTEEGASPGATDVTAANGLPFPGRTAGWSVWRTEDPTKEDRISTKLFHVAAGYHETMEIPLLAGRTFTGADGPDAQRVALIDESLAVALWPDESPLGSQMHYPPWSGSWPTSSGRLLPGIRRRPSTFPLPSTRDGRCHLPCVPPSILDRSCH